jgi:hypothetical protein
MLDRRTFVTALPLLGLAARAPDPAGVLLDRAIARAGGREALSNARVLRWTGEATVQAGDRRIEIGVDTMVEPFVRARSKSWLKSDGPEKSRTLILEPGQGWVERDGVRSPMPDAMRVHEEQQFAIYGLMRLVGLDGPDFLLRREGDTLRVQGRGLPDTKVAFTSDGLILSLENEVAHPEGGDLIPQRIALSGRMPGPIAWPRRIDIWHHEQPFFELRLTSFAASER